MSQEQINLRLRMTRRLKESHGRAIQCEKCGIPFSPVKRAGTNRMPNNWYICPKCGYDGKE